ncbi:gamma carbonic anhydrase family protein [Nonomuraea longicatena]|uniref:gamma carbonic anhydrase family protein n=1 Tax=Nonomuraea longicatena TaxID=83682 RepID=UPI003CD05757
MYIAALDGGAVPRIHAEAFVAPGAVVVGRVSVGRAASIWYGSVLRGDDERIEIGEECNVQDLCCLHADPGQPAILEPRVSLGHKAMVHGAYVETGALVGIGAIVLGGARIGAGTLVAAGALVGPGKRIPAGVLVAGVPGRVVRELTDADRASFARTPDSYQAKAIRHRSATPVPEQPAPDQPATD